MSKLKTIVLSALLFFGLYILVGVVLTAIFVDCDSVLLVSSDSPDNRYRVSIGAQTCEDPEEDGVYLVIIGLETDAYLNRLILPDTSVRGFEIAWPVRNELEITVPSGVSFDSLQGPSNVDELTVIYRIDDGTMVEGRN